MPRSILKTSTPPYDQHTSPEYHTAALLELQEQARALGCEVVAQGHLDVLAKERRYLIAEVERLRGKRYSPNLYPPDTLAYDVHELRTAMAKLGEQLLAVVGGGHAREVA
jgi:hypothetical protein